MIQNVIDALFGSKHEADLKKLLPILHEVNELESWAVGLSETDIKQKSAEFRGRLAKGESTTDELLPQAYAIVREAARRVLGERLYDVQILGGIVLHQGRIMEMKTGEGKTVSSVTAAYLNALTGRGVHVITVNDYLASRDAAWMGPVYEYLGVSVGAITAGMENAERAEAYRQDITYGTNNEFGFDYLRDNMRFDASQKVQRGHNYCIIDEIDSILIDEARTPLIISGVAQDDVQKYKDVNSLIRELRECEKDPETNDYPEEPEGDYKLDEKGRKVSFTDEGLNHIESILQKRKLISGSLFEPENFEYIHHFTQALKAHKLFHRDTHYVVADGQVQIVDEFTGRILHGRRYSDGLHQAIEAKEGIKVAQRNRTLATITFQNFFRMYEKISGMTGTAATEEKEFGKIYGLDVVVIPTNRPLARVDQDDVIYINEKEKLEAIAEELQRLHEKGQPVLVGTISIEKSEELSEILTRRGIRHEVLNAKNHAREALIIAEAGAKGSVTIATNMAGRGTDIKLGGNPEFRARRRLGDEATDEEYYAALKEERPKWREQYEEVKELGGLFVLGTERHESRRIDNQLRGRSGRQGDPGESRFFISMDDDLMRLFGKGGSNLKAIMERGLPPGEPLNHPLINKSIERAQTKVEERNFDIRKHLLEFDDVLNEQRKLIYSQRDEILKDQQLTERVLNTARGTMEQILEEAPPERAAQGNRYAHFAEALKERLFYAPEMPPEEMESLEPETLIDALVQEMREDLEKKKRIATPERFNLAIRIEYLRNIDAKWQDHLEDLEALREAVYLRSYAQKNPLLEYKLEGFQIFDQLIEQIRGAVAKKVLAVKAESLEAQQEEIARRSRAAHAVAQHGRFALFQGGPEAAEPAAATPGPQGQEGVSGKGKRSTAPTLNRNQRKRLAKKMRK
ncbi:MAG: preprotein translocase subunit SecA [Alkalispirochaetaceae bacterium]